MYRCGALEGRCSIEALPTLPIFRLRPCVLEEESHACLRTFRTICPFLFFSLPSRDAWGSCSPFPARIFIWFDFSWTIAVRRTDGVCGAW